MRVVIVGSVDHGKSTLIGRLLYDSGNLPESRLSEMQLMAEEYKKKFEFSSFLDSFSDEIKEERTIDTTEVFFKGEYLHTLIDVPGHLEFIEAMLTGASNAEAAIVVVDVTKGLEEQTKRHLNLIKLLGINHVIVALNKMDLVDYDILKYSEVWGSLHDFTDKFGQSNYTVVPISAREGTNVYTRFTWFASGINSLLYNLDLLEEFKAKREIPKVFIVQGEYKGLVLGKGKLNKNDVVTFYPSGLESKVLDVSETNAIILSNGLPRRGEVAGLINYKIPKLAWCKVFALDRVKENEELDFRCGTARISVRVKSIDKRLSSETLEELERASLKRHELGFVTLWLLEPIVVQSFEEVPELGRFTLSRKGKSVGIGVIENYE